MLLSGCRGWQSALNPQSPQAQSLGNLFWAFVSVLTLVWVATLAVLAMAVWRQRRSHSDPLFDDHQTDQRIERLVGYSTALTGLILIALTGISYAAQKHLFGDSAAARTITIMGRQWWWEVRYMEADGTKSLVTANDIHLPVGEPVRVELASADVIHSFWVPNLFGKRDLVPGLDNAIRFTPSQVGTWRGQCAEFCGLQHAHMALHVVVEGKADFARWQSEQLAEASQSSDAELQAGQAVFFYRECNICHAIRGTPANGAVGPDLTHVASRQWIAAGAVSMSREALSRWIADPHAIKPGVHMPASALEPDELANLSVFLESLK